MFLCGTWCQCNMPGRPPDFCRNTPLPCAALPHPYPHLPASPVLCRCVWPPMISFVGLRQLCFHVCRKNVSNKGQWPHAHICCDLFRCVQRPACWDLAVIMAHCGCHCCVALWVYCVELAFCCMLLILAFAAHLLVQHRSRGSAHTTEFGCCSWNSQECKLSVRGCQAQFDFMGVVPFARSSRDSSCLGWLVVGVQPKAAF